MKNNFHYHKNPIAIDDVDIHKILISSKIYFGKKSFKYFTPFIDNEKFNPLCIILAKMSGYTKSFNETKYVFFDKR